MEKKMYIRFDQSTDRVPQMVNGLDTRLVGIPNISLESLDLKTLGRGKCGRPRQTDDAL